MVSYIHSIRVIIVDPGVGLFVEVNINIPLLQETEPRTPIYRRQ
jgi:hypothetical protein